MAGRSTRARRRAPEPELRPFPSLQVVETWPDGDWVVRQLTGSSSTKPYRCPGCVQLIPPATPHLVAWPAEDGLQSEPLAERRHWHTGCWRARERRRPR